MLLVANIATADIFGTGNDVFTIDFVGISGDASSANGTNIGSSQTFSDPINNYRMGTYEITNDQSANFTYNNPSFTGINMPANRISWYEVSQFANYLNSITNHQEA